MLCFVLMCCAGGREGLSRSDSDGLRWIRGITGLCKKSHRQWIIISIINTHNYHHYPQSLPPYHHNYLTNDINVIKIIKCISGLSKNEKNPFSNHLQPQSTNTVKLIFIILPRDPYIFIHIILTSQPRSLDVWYHWCDCIVKGKDTCILVVDPF